MNLSDNSLVAFVCGGFGLVMLVLIVSSLREAAAMKRWPVARGRVLSSKVEQYRSDAGSGHFGGARARMTLYRAVVTYEYEVDDRRFRSERIAQSPGMDKGIPDFAQRTAQRYATGTAVHVFYNPKRHGECVLEPRVPRSWIFALVIALALLGAAAEMYYR